MLQENKKSFPRNKTNKQKKPNGRNSMPTVTEPTSSFHKYLSSFHVRGITLDARYTAADKKDQVSVELSLHSTHKLLKYFCP